MKSGNEDNYDLSAFIGIYSIDEILKEIDSNDRPDENSLELYEKCMGFIDEIGAVIAVSKARKKSITKM